MALDKKPKIDEVQLKEYQDKLKLAKKQIDEFLAENTLASLQEAAGVLDEAFKAGHAELREELLISEICIGRKEIGDLLGVRKTKQLATMIRGDVEKLLKIIEKTEVTIQKSAPKPTPVKPTPPAGGERKGKEGEQKREPEIKNINQAYDAIDKKLDSNADRLAWTIRIIKRLHEGTNDVPAHFFYDRNGYFEIDNSLPAPEKEAISKKIMEAVYIAMNPFLRTILNSKIDYDNPPILKKILELNGLPKTRAEAQKRIDDVYSQVKEIIKLGKDEFNKEKTKKSEEKKRLEEEEKKKKEEEQRKKEEEEKKRLEEEKRLEKLKNKPFELPSDMPVMTREIAEELTKDKADERKVLIIAWAIYKGHGSKILKKEDQEAIVNIVKNLVQFSKTDNTLMRDATKLDISDLLTKYKDALLALPEVEKKLRFVENMKKTLGMLFKDMDDKLQLCFQTLEIDPNTCVDDEEKNNLERIQKYIFKVLNVKIPGVYGINNGEDYDKNLKDLAGKDLDELNEEAKSKEVVKLMDELEKEIKKYQNYSERKKKEGGKPPSDGGGGNITDLLLEHERKEMEERAAREKSEVSADSISKLMSAILSDSAFYHKKDPASLAIEALIREKVGGNGLPELKGFLLKPKITLSEGVSELVDKQSLTQLNAQLKENQVKIKEKQSEIDIAKVSLGKIVNKDASDALRMDLKKHQKDLTAFEKEKEQIEAAISYKNGTMRYYSTPQVLAMINLYLAMKNNENTTQKNIMKLVEAQIESQRKNVYSVAGKIVNVGFGILSVGGLLKPRLTGTLKMIAKDEQLSKIGEEKLGKLAKAWDNRGAVDAWVSSLEGSEEDRMTRIVPRIIAYLELALRDGNMRYLRLGSAYKAKGLVNNLKNARHDYIMNKVESQSQGTSDVDKMNAYFRELNRATVSQAAITKKIVTRGSTYRALGRLATYGTLGAGAGLAGVALAGLSIPVGMATGVGVLGGGAAAGGGVLAMKSKSPTLKKVAKSGALRTAAATSLGVGALALGVGGIAAAIAALPGILSPEFFKKRKELGKAGLLTVKKTAWLTKAAGIVGLTGGLALLSPRLRKLAFA